MGSLAKKIAKRNGIQAAAAITPFEHVDKGLLEDLAKLKTDHERGRFVIDFARKICARALVAERTKHRQQIELLERKIDLLSKPQIVLTDN